MNGKCAKCKEHEKLYDYPINNPLLALCLDCILLYEEKNESPTHSEECEDKLRDFIRN